MLEQEIRKVLKKKKLTPIDVYKPLEINRVNFYKAIKTSNLENKSLKKILEFLGIEVSIKLKTKKMKTKESKIYKKLYLTNSYEAVTDKQMDHFVIYGDTNWNYYFDKIVENKDDFEEVEDVKLIEFFTQEDLEKYLKDLPDTKMLDYSFDESFIAVLELVD